MLPALTIMDATGQCQKKCMTQNISLTGRGAVPSHEHPEAHLPIPLERLEHLERTVCLPRVLRQPLVWESPDFLLPHRTTNPAYPPGPEGELPRQLSPAWEMGVEQDTEHDSAGRAGRLGPV